MTLYFTNHERNYMIYKLHKEGWTFDKLGKEFKLTRTRCYQIYHKYRIHKTLSEKQYCYFCGKYDTICTHHLDQNRKNDSFDNIVLLCPSCHTKLHYLYPSILHNTFHKT